MIHHLTTRNKSEWHRVLSKIPSADCYAYPEFGTIWEGSYPYRFEAVWGEYDGVTVLYPFLVRPLAELPFGFQIVSELGNLFDITTPEYGGIFHSDPSEMRYDVATEFSKDFGSWCNEKGIVTEFGRIQPVLNNIVLGPGYNVRRVGQIVWVDLTKSEDELREEMTKEGRKKLRQAESRGITISKLSPDGFTNFIPLYMETMKHHLANERYLYPTNFFDSMMRTPEDFCFILGAFSEGQLVSSVIVLAGGKVGYSYLSATNREFQNLRPNNILFWEMLMECKRMGLTHFVLGGGAGADDGTYRFKLNFSTLEKDFYIYDRTHKPEVYKRIIEIKTEYEHNNGCKEFDPSSVGFFPIYRAVWRSELL